MKTKKSHSDENSFTFVVGTLAWTIVSILAAPCLAQESGDSDPAELPPLSAEVMRYELGQRLRRFEIAFESHLGESERGKALPVLRTAVSNFFSGNMDDAASALDEAWVTLLPEGQQELARLVSATRIETSGFAESGEDGISFKLTTIRSKGEDSIWTQILGEGCQLVFQWKQTGGQGLKDEHVFDIDLDSQRTEARLELLLPEPGQYAVKVLIRKGDIEWQAADLLVAVIERFDDRVADLQTQLDESKKADPGWQPSVRSTVKERLRTLKRWKEKNDLETNFAAATELERLESLVKNASRTDWVTSSFGNIHQGGDYWLKLAGERRKKASFRLFVPTLNAEAFLSDATEKFPCVIALHGAGGSENMFFDGYGDGKILRLAGERKWFVIAPRLRLGGAGMSLQAIVDQLAKQLPIDRQTVFVIGHSMGAGYAMEATAETMVVGNDFGFRAVAALGGGGQRLKVFEEATPAFFVAAGSDDFGLAGASSLHKGLDDSGFDSQFHKYSNTEHMGIVQVALEDVFEFFDQNVNRDER